MAKKIRWDNPKATEALDHRTISIEETVTKTETKKLTIANIRDEMAQLERKIVNCKRRKVELEAELKEVKKALGVE